MKLLKSLSGFLFLVILFSSVYAQSANEILDKHFDAINQEKLVSVETIKMNINMSMQGMEMPLTILQKRPDKIRTEAEMQGMKIVTIFNGKEGWMINPMMGSAEPQQIPAEQLETTKGEADMDGALYNYADKGHKLVKLDDSEIEGKSVYVLELNKKGGDKIKYYIDKNDHLILKSASTVTNMGMTMELESKHLNYKEVNGILFPHKIEIISNGQLFQTMTFTNIEMDGEIENSVFDKSSLTK